MTRNSTLVRLGLILLAGAANVMPHALAADAASCGETCLKDVADQYIAAMLAHRPADVPLAPDAIITENAQQVKLGDGVWKSAVKMYSTISSNQYVTDTKTGQVGFMGVLDDGGQPAMYALRLSVENGKITQVETLVAHKNDGPFWPMGYIYREGPYIRTIPADKRNTREELLATDDIYWKTVVGSHDGNAIPYSNDCWHFENGMNTNWERPLTAMEAAHPEIVANQPQDYDGRIWICAREVDLSTQSWKSTKGLHQLVDPERGLVMSWVLVDRGGQGSGPRNGGAPPTGKGGGMAAPGVPGFYGPPSPGPDGWPLPNSFQNPNKSPKMDAGLGGAGALNGWQYQVSLMRIVGGKITRDQTFEAKAPQGASLPY